MINDIPLKRIKNSTRIVYSSAIAHQLASRIQRPINTIATELAAILRTHQFTGVEGQKVDFRSNLLLSQSTPLDRTVWVTPTGLIQLEIGDRAIAAGLEALLHHALAAPRRPPASGGVSLRTNSALARHVFMAQHAHARCCSLLRLAHSERVVHLNLLNSHPLTWQFTDPNPIPWLASAHQLRLNHPTERGLICKIFATLDVLEENFPQKSDHLLVDALGELSQAFQTFHRDRPLFKQQFPDAERHSQAQLGLLLVTQRVLHFLLTEMLQVTAPQVL